MDLTSVVLAPVRAGRLAVRAAEDLHAVAERARRDPDPVTEVRDQLDALLEGLWRLTDLIVPLHAAVLQLTATAAAVDLTGRDIVSGGEELTAVARALDRHGAELVGGGRDLVAVSERLDAHSAELIDGGQDLTAVAQELAASLRVFRTVLPRLIESLETVEQLEGAVETVAETVEPLAGAAEGVGKITRKLSRSRRA
jgi:methyl-accepting chemotaxis protein